MAGCLTCWRAGDMCIKPPPKHGTAPCPNSALPLSAAERMRLSRGFHKWLTGQLATISTSSDSDMDMD